MTGPEPIHPGEHLAEIMAVLGITQYRLAKTMGVPQMRIHEIVHRRRSITADTALRLGQALGMTPDFWLNLQQMYALDVARAKTDVSTIEPLVEMSARQQRGLERNGQLEQVWSEPERGQFPEG